MALPQKITIAQEAVPLHSHDCEALRRICADLPGVAEAESGDQTSFKVGQRSFVVIETYRDPSGKPFYCMAFKASFFDHERLVQDANFFPAPYLGGPGWLGRRLDHAERPIDWQDMASILARSHRQIAGRMTPSARALSRDTGSSV